MTHGNATNSLGWEVQRFHPLPVGWITILQEPFATKSEATRYMLDMPKAKGVEVRVYEALS